MERWRDEHSALRPKSDGNDGNSPGTRPGEMIAQTERKGTADVRKCVCES